MTGVEASAGDASATAPTVLAVSRAAAQTRVQLPTMTFIYDAEHAPKAIGKAFKAEVNMVTSTYQEPANPDDLNAKFEAVAEASTHPEAEAKPPAPPAQN